MGDDDAAPIICHNRPAKAMQRHVVFGAFHCIAMHFLVTYIANYIAFHALASQRLYFIFFKQS